MILQGRFDYNIWSGCLWLEDKHFAKGEGGLGDVDLTEHIRVHDRAFERTVHGPLDPYVTFSQPLFQLKQVVEYDCNKKLS